MESFIAAFIGRIVGVALSEAMPTIRQEIKAAVLEALTSKSEDSKTDTELRDRLLARIPDGH